METSAQARPLRWLHLSDFHVGKDGYAQDTLFQQLLEHIRVRQEEGFRPDFVFITGDIANRGLQSEYEAFVLKFLHPLYSLLDHIPRDRFFIIPGNHDVFRAANRYFDRDEIAGLQSHFFDPTDEGRLERLQFLPRFAAYRDNPAICSPDWLASPRGYFAQSLDFAGIQIGIVCINTAWLSKDKADRHQLSPGINLLDHALREVEACGLKVVLGHHPVDWFRDDHLASVRAILGRHRALYLHGHLHVSRVSPEDGAGFGFLCIQSGAAFHARGGDRWVNGILWGEVDFNDYTVRLQPREWDLENWAWRLGKDLPESRRLANSDWWVFPLPTHQSITPTSRVSVMDGWQQIDSRWLTRHGEPLDKGRALRFFDGAIPDWSVALSPSIPRLSIVETTHSRLVNYSRDDKPQLILITGPTGEGKSTVLMQAVEAVLRSNPDWTVLWRVNASVRLVPSDIDQLPRNQKPWLLVLDAGELGADDLYRTCQMLWKAQRSDIRFLVASRDTDWKAQKAHRYEWLEYSGFEEVQVSGISADDAAAIVAAWEPFGSEALGHLAGVDQETAAKKLLGAATRESTIKGGSLLGALLRVRYGNDLKEHLKSLLRRLADRPILGGGNLLSAFSYIAAMHSEGLEFLSRPVLAGVLGIPIGRLNPLVLNPLGLEAATSSDGQYILTRHRSISHAVVALLEDLFDDNIEDMYIDLLKSVTQLRNNGERVPELSRWYYGISTHFENKGRHDLAVRIARITVELNPHYLPLRLHLSRLYRDTRSSGAATLLFRDYQRRIVGRAAFIEWSVAEDLAGHPAIGALLAAFALSDQGGEYPLDLGIAPKVLNVLAATLQHLYERYAEFSFSQAVLSAVRLGFALQPNAKTQQELEHRLSKVSVEMTAEDDDLLVSYDERVRDLADALGNAWAYAGADEAIAHEYIGSPQQLSFSELLRLLQNVAAAKSEEISSTADD
jgi:hypothetical protein